eukprot:TRINITY_DN73625_c0_g1_i1.p1 TRINITY_DN73625_c0_g1~~TRINITY_DN73625_c0_g1_i1.p1  ORF type:complete len:381 (-),score=71.19 TRINITY_DN73625_c0_g1_i1:46-1188(-)
MEVPTISLAAYFASNKVAAESRDADARNAGLDQLRDEGVAAIVGGVRRACEEVGFFVVTDHGIDASLMNALRKECLEFFDRPPQSVVLGMVPSGDASGRFRWLDYVPPEQLPSEPIGGLATSTAVGDSCNANHAKTNGSRMPAKVATGCGEAGAADVAAWSIGPMEGRGSMHWLPDSEALSKTWMAYYSEMERLVCVLMRLFALALELAIDCFDEALEGHRSSMRAILYPEVPEAEITSAAVGADNGEVVRSGEHTDWGCVTVLLADPDVGGLEIRRKDGSLVPLIPPAGGLVVNLGDLMQRWTAGRWVATPHRVVARPESRCRRLSVPYFGLVNRATELKPLVPGACGDDDVVITAGDFFDQHEAHTTRQRGAVGEEKT